MKKKCILMLSVVASLLVFVILKLILLPIKNDTVIITNIINMLCGLCIKTFMSCPI